jgi:putative transposase
VVSGANVNDLTMLAELLDARVLPIPEAAVAEGLHLCLDKGYDYRCCRDAAQERLFTVHIPRKLGTEEIAEGAERHPARRWVVEVCHSWLNRFRRLLVRWEKTLRNHLGFLQLAICLIIYRKLRKRARLSG